MKASRSESPSISSIALPASLALRPSLFAGAETLSVSSAASHIEQQTGHRPNPATLWRWMDNGKLPSFFVGRRRFTTRTAVDELLAAFNAAKHDVLAPAAPRADVQQAGADAAKRIARMGG